MQNIVKSTCVRRYKYKT